MVVSQAVKDAIDQFFSNMLAKYASHPLLTAAIQWLKDEADKEITVS